MHKQSPESHLLGGGGQRTGLGAQLSLATRGEDWASQGQPKGKAEIPVVTRECRRNSRKTTWFQRLRKMRPLQTMASQGKSIVPPGQVPLMHPG